MQILHKIQQGFSRKVANHANLCWGTIIIISVSPGKLNMRIANLKHGFPLATFAVKPNDFAYFGYQKLHFHCKRQRFVEIPGISPEPREFILDFFLEIRRNILPILSLAKEIFYACPTEWGWYFPPTTKHSRGPKIVPQGQTRKSRNEQKPL